MPDLVELESTPYMKIRYGGIWYGKGRIYYSHHGNDLCEWITCSCSCMFRIVKLSSRSAHSNFHWETWATSCVLNGVDGNWKLGYVSRRLRYCHYSNGYSHVLGMPSWTETLSTPTSIGIHGQTSLSGTASKETTWVVILSPFQQLLNRPAKQSSMYMVWSQFVNYRRIYVNFCPWPCCYESADINECRINNGGCDAVATCTNTAGSRTCACATGYVTTNAGVTCRPTGMVLVFAILTPEANITLHCAVRFFSFRLVDEQWNLLLDFGVAYLRLSVSFCLMNSISIIIAIASTEVK